MSAALGDAPLSEDDLHALYLWVDDIPLSRPKRNISRDFADGVCVAEIVKYYFPRLVELHNYTASCNAKQKQDNWETLNAKVFRRLQFEVPAEVVRNIMAAVPGAIEGFLKALQTKIVQVKQKNDTMLLGADGVGGADAHYAAPLSTGERRSGATRPPSAGAAASGAAGGAYRPRDGHAVDPRDHNIQEMRQSLALLNEKIAHLESLLQIKDSKIVELERRLRAAGVAK